MSGMVRTVLGDVDGDALGITYAHEHLIIDSPLVIERWPHIHLPSVEGAVAELERCRDAGVGTVVDAMPSASGRDVGRLATISERSGLNIIAVTGFHTAKYYEGQNWALNGSVESLAAHFIAEVEEGADGTPHKTGLIKVATSGVGLTSMEARVFEAAAMTARITGVPILTHCEDGKGAIEQIEKLTALGVPPERVVISHLDKVDDPGYHRAVLETGVYAEYDQALRHADESPPPTAIHVVRMWEAGFGDRIMLATDGARRSLWATHGSPHGLAWLATGFVAELRAQGLGDHEIDTMFVVNPGHFFPMAQLHEL